MDSDDDVEPVASSLASLGGVGRASTAEPKPAAAEVWPDKKVASDDDGAKSFEATLC